VSAPLLDAAPGAAEEAAKPIAVPPAPAMPPSPPSPPPDAIIASVLEALPGITTPRATVSRNYTLAHISRR